MRPTMLGLCALVALTGACGEDEAPKLPAAGGRNVAKPAAPAAPPRGSGAPGAVVTYRRVEDRAGSDEERKRIRVPLIERDFAPDLTGNDNRDPFRSFVITQAGVGTGQPGTPAEATEQCPKKRQWARGFSVRELKVVGIVSRGTIRYALFSDPSQYGYVIHTGDCLGKEKARVKEIGASFVTYETSSEVAPNQPPRPAEEISVQLHPKDLPVGENDSSDEDLPAGEPRRRPAPPRVPDDDEAAPPLPRTPPAQQ